MVRQTLVRPTILLMFRIKSEPKSIIQYSYAYRVLSLKGDL